MSDRHKLFLGIFLILGVLAYGVYQWNERSALLLKVNALNAEASNLTASSNALKEDYDEIKVEVSLARETSAQELALVFPTDEDLTPLTRLFDDFAVKNNFESNPFFISNLSYEAEQSSADGLYRYVPLRMNFLSSKKNLNKFLEFVENSGSLEGEVRLMSIEDLTVNYPAEFGGSYDVQVKINAYFSQEI